MTEKKEFDEKKSYEWSKDDEFKVNGSTIELFNMLISLQVSTTEYKKFLIYQKAAELMRDVFKENINVLKENEKKEG